MAFDAVILAGGRARRLGGADKPGLTVGGRSLVEHVVAAVAGARTTVVVGPEREIPGVVFVREDPPGGGPVPALTAGLEQVTAPWVVLLAGDLPFMMPGHVKALLAAASGTPDQAPRTVPSASARGVGIPEETRTGPSRSARGAGTPEQIRTGASAPPRGAGTPEQTRTGPPRSAPGARTPDTEPHSPPGGARTSEPALATGTPGIGEVSGTSGATGGVVMVDDGGREQWLAGAWPTGPLKEALAAYAGRSLKGLLGPLVAVRLSLPGRPWFDCDTMDDLEEARMHVLNEWTALACEELGIDPARVDRDKILDLTKEVAHGVARPAAPLTAYLLGLAQGAGTASDDAVEKLITLAKNWGQATSETLTDS
ncbi:NTP transferase domain-containing protein [Nonomuraea phyllanthi]|uniref:NTP transferase domain-containing protein n=1 Tax=Nonomuraea phyllanthi TaxID=2219224 RepID=A0A5C4WPY5_9ACTN|nr:NTP transferase domain-containing protein [Nonomuraea phyllanthi]